MVGGRKVMLLGIAIILLGICCNLYSVSIITGVVSGMIEKYAHWVGITITIIGFAIPDGEK